MAITGTFETGVNGNAITTADAGSATAWDAITAIGATPTYDNAHAYDALADKMVLTGSTSEATISWNTAFGTQTDHYGRVYLWLDAAPSGGSIRLVHGTTGGSLAWRLLITPGRLIALIDSTGSTMGQMTSTVSTGQFVRIEWHVIHSTSVGQAEAKLFNNADSTTATEVLTSAASFNTLANSNAIKFGHGSGEATTATFWLDNIVAGATSYPGSAINQPPRSQYLDYEFSHP